MGSLDEGLACGDVFKVLVVEVGAVLVVETGDQGYVVVAWK